MKMTLYMVTVSLLLNIALAEDCPPQWDNFKDDCYYVYQSNWYTYEEAKTVCAGKGGHLLTIDENEEDLYARGLTDSLCKVDLWIGLRNDESAGEWQWDDGSALSYTNWAAAEPGNGDCGFLSAANVGRWKAAACSKRCGFICEKTREQSQATTIGPCVSVPVGLESGAITDAQMIASSEFPGGYDAPAGRLNNNHYHWATNFGAQTVGQWMQIDLGRPRKVSKVATQGRGYNNAWVSSYNLKYTDDGGNWQYVTDSSGNPKVFQGNTDTNSVVYQELGDDSFTSRYIRFYPVTWVTWLAMRAEIYACE